LFAVLLLQRLLLLLLLCRQMVMVVVWWVAVAVAVAVWTARRKLHPVALRGLDRCCATALLGVGFLGAGETTSARRRGAVVGGAACCRLPPARDGARSVC
jgi:hypothetical protein